MTCNPKQCIMGSRCDGCPLAEKRIDPALVNEMDSRIRYWRPGPFAPPIEARWVKPRTHRKSAEMVVWTDPRHRVPLNLRRFESPMGEPSCMRCPARQWRTNVDAPEGEGESEVTADSTNE
ncbi:hypothetical protein AGMMS49992_11480 [Clostridia bacterium]|nr:hypothetical protein AGMMS49992_11480 [Clostridia bacterium]